MSATNLAELNVNSNLYMWTNPTSISEIKSICAPKLTDGEFKAFMQIGKATNLNPFLREIWAVKFGDNPANIFIGRDGYRKSAQSHPLYDYHLADAVYEKDEFSVENGQIKHKYTLVNRGKLMGAYCIVKRKNSSLPIYVFVELSEYSTGKSLWNSQNGKPATMIKKVAEAQALRSAFQELFAGTYDESEQWENKSTNLKVVNSSSSRIIEEEKEERLDNTFDIYNERLLKCDNLADLQAEFKLAYTFFNNKNNTHFLEKITATKDKMKKQFEMDVIRKLENEIDPTQEIDIISGEIVNL